MWSGTHYSSRRYGNSHENPKNYNRIPEPPGANHVLLLVPYMHPTIWLFYLAALSTAKPKRTPFQLPKPPPHSSLIVSLPPSPSPPCADPACFSPTKSASSGVVLMIANIAVWIVVTGSRSAWPARLCARVVEWPDEQVTEPVDYVYGRHSIVTGELCIPETGTTFLRKIEMSRAVRGFKVLRFGEEKQIHRTKYIPRYISLFASLPVRCHYHSYGLLLFGADTKPCGNQLKSSSSE